MVSHLTWSSCSFNKAGSQQAPTFLPPLSRSAGVIGVDGILLLFNECWNLTSLCTPCLHGRHWDNWAISLPARQLLSALLKVELSGRLTNWPGRLASSCLCLFSTGIVGTHCWPFLWVLGIWARVLMLAQAVSHLPSSRGRLLLCVLFSVLKFVCEFKWSKPTPIFLEVKPDYAPCLPETQSVNQADLEFKEVLQPLFT